MIFGLTLPLNAANPFLNCNNIYNSIYAEILCHLNVTNSDNILTVSFSLKTLGASFLICENAFFLFFLKMLSLCLYLIAYITFENGLQESI